MKEATLHGLPMVQGTHGVPLFEEARKGLGATQRARRKTCKEASYVADHGSKRDFRFSVGGGEKRNSLVNSIN